MGVSESTIFAEYIRTDSSAPGETCPDIVCADSRAAVFDEDAAYDAGRWRRDSNALRPYDVQKV